MHRALTPGTTLESLRKDAKRWLKDLRAADPEAHARLRSAWPAAPPNPGLRDIQHALAREFGVESWARLKHVVAEQRSHREAADEATVKAFFEAAAHGDDARVAAILDRHPGLVNERRVVHGHTGLRTALHYATGGSHEAVIKALLERGADPNIRDEGDFATPLHFAAEKRDLGIIRLLIEHGADPIADGDYHELGVLGWATAFDYLAPRRDVVDYLLAHGAAHNIFSAVAVGETDAIRRLVAATPANLERRMDLTNKRRMPLHLAVVKKQRAALETLLELGANTEALDERNLTALDQAALDGAHDLAARLIDRGASVRLPAAVALQRSHEIDRILREDPDCLKPGHNWEQLIVTASYSAAGPVIETLIRHGASVNVRAEPKHAVDGTSHFTPLHAAASAGNASAVDVLLKHAANPSAREEKYCGTPAGWANYSGHDRVRDQILLGPIDIFEALDFDLVDRIPGILQRDAEALTRPFGEYVAAQPRANQWWPDPACTPLMWAILKGKEDAARVLREHGARG